MKILYVFVYYIYMICKATVWADHLMTFKNAAFGEMKRDLLVDRFVLASSRLFTEVWNSVLLECCVIQIKGKVLKS